MQFEEWPPSQHKVIRNVPSVRNRLKKAALLALLLVLVVIVYHIYTERLGIHNYVRPVTKFWHPECNCSREIATPVSPNGSKQQQKSTCGPVADNLGPHQSVISFVFYGNTTNKYFSGVERNANSVLKLYPGWRMRLYHDISPTDQNSMEELCEVVCGNPILDLCYVDDLADRLGYDLKSKFEMVWRFMVLGDPLVDVFCSRDLDSTIQQREVDAVNEWLESDKTWHTMKDHPGHKQPMMGGLWGVKNAVNVKLMENFRNKILKKNNRKGYGVDQYLIEDIVFPTARKSLMAHDSYYCKENKNSIPYPTQRSELNFLGSRKVPVNWKEIKICPEACRPAKHKDWKYC